MQIILHVDKLQVIAEIVDDGVVAGDGITELLNSLV